MNSTALLLQSDPDQLDVDGVNYGFIQASDRLEGDFTDQDEANLVRLAALTSTALDALARLHLPEYRPNDTTQDTAP